MPTAPVPGIDHADGPEASVPARHGLIFIEYFAGTAVLTAEVRRLRVEHAPPQDQASGGSNFLDRGALAAERDRLRQLAGRGHLIVHLAPPCATFSRARDRSQRTRLRSARWPAGLPTLTGKTRKLVREANRIALRAWRLACFAHEELGATVTLENPALSYLWAYLAQLGRPAAGFTDVLLDQCMHGAPWKKPTRFRCLGVVPTEIGKRCRRSGGSHSCGQTTHEVLEFGGSSTQAAARYPRKLCVAYGKFLNRLRCERVNLQQGLAEVRFHGAGEKIARHERRGPTGESTRERRAQEDQACNAGMRNAAWVVRRSPGLLKGLAKARGVLLDHLRRNVRLRGLDRCLGPRPDRAPPPEEDVRAVLKDLAKAYCSTAEHFSKPGTNSPWRFAEGLVGQGAARGGSRSR